MLDLVDLCRAWQLPPIIRTWAPETGTIHRTLLLETSGGNYALRAYRYTAEDRWRIVCEHALIAYVESCGIPALPPVPLANGESILEQDGRFYALFPFARGHHLSRHQLTSEAVSAMGRFLGQLHQVLHDYPPDRVPSRSLAVNQASTLATMDTIEAAIRAQTHLSAEDEQALSRLAERRAWLTNAPVVRETDISQLEHQVIHGDYQDTNLFFEDGEDGQISAVIDWDQSYVAPRAWEVVRTLHYVCKLDGPLCRIFLTAYRDVLPLTPEELDLAAAAYGWMRGHDLWHYKAIYLEGNQRVRTFLQPGPFIPFAQKWGALRAYL